MSHLRSLNDLKSYPNGNAANLAYVSITLDDVMWCEKQKQNKKTTCNSGYKNHKSNLHLSWIPRLHTSHYGVCDDITDVVDMFIGTCLSQSETRHPGAWGAGLHAANRTTREHDSLRFRARPRVSLRRGLFAEPHAVWDSNKGNKLKRKNTLVINAFCRPSCLCP